MVSEDSGEGVTQDKGVLLVGGEGAPIWLADVIEKGCEELDKIRSDMRDCWAFQNEVDLQFLGRDHCFAA